MYKKNCRGADLFNYSKVVCMFSYWQHYKVGLHVFLFFGITVGLLIVANIIHSVVQKKYKILC